MVVLSRGWSYCSITNQPLLIFSQQALEKTFSPIRKIFIAETLKAAAQNQNILSSPADYINFLKDFYQVVYPLLTESVIKERFENIEKCIANFTDREGLASIMRKEFPRADAQRIYKALNAYENDLSHHNNRLAMLKIYTIADIIERKTNNRNRLEFLYTAISDSNSLKI